jgi:hypothetical protein
LMANIDLAGLIETEKLRIEVGLGPADIPEVKTYGQLRGEVRADWQNLFDSQRAQQHAQEVARSVAPLLLDANVMPDITFYDYAMQPVEERRPKRGIMGLQRTEVTHGWLLREQENGPVATLDRSNSDGINPGPRDKTAAVDENGHIHVLGIQPSGLLESGSLIMGTHEVPYSPDLMLGREEGNPTGKPWIELVGDEASWVERVRWSPGHKLLEEADTKGRVARGAIPYMARLLAFNNIDITPAVPLQ